MPIVVRNRKARILFILFILSKLARAGLAVTILVSVLYRSEACHVRAFGVYYPQS